MSNPFAQATASIFANADFAESATFGSTSAVVIRSKITEAEELRQFGIDEGVSFFLRVQVASLAAPPKRNDLVTFGGVEYRVDRVELDSADQTYAVYLKSKSSR